MRIVKNFFIALFVLAISSAIFYTQITDEEVKEDILRTTLEAFGDELLAMVPEGGQKTDLERRYQDFLTRAEQNQVPPEKIEDMAATILNIAAQDSEISAEQAIEVLDFEPPAALGSIPAPEMAGEKKSWTLDRERKRELAGRLRSMRNLKKQIERYSEAGLEMPPAAHRVVFIADSGLHALVAPEIREMVKQMRLEEFEREMNEMERERILHWRRPPVPPALHDVPPQIRRPLQILAMTKYTKLDSLAKADPDSFQKWIEQMVKSSIPGDQHH